MTKTIEIDLKVYKALIENKMLVKSAKADVQGRTSDEAKAIDKLADMYIELVEVFEKVVEGGDKDEEN